MPRLLVVDDNPKICQMLERHLKKLGHETFLAKSAESAFDILEHTEIDLMLLDQSMPEMEGTETIKIIREEKKLILPVIMLTAYGSTTLATEFMKLGGNDFIEKPIDFEILQLRIMKTLQNFQNQEKLKELYISQKAEKKTHELKKLFIALMGHRLKSPLQGILGFADLSRQILENPDTIQHDDLTSHVQSILESGMQLQRVIDDVIKITFLETGLFLDIKEYHVHTLEQALQEKLVSTPEGQLSVTVDLPETLPFVKIDDEALTQVLYQLIDNAVQFTPAGGSLSIKAEVNHPEQISLYISDTGVGIDKKNHEEIFNLFVTLDHTGTSPGSGIGLYWAKRLIEMMNGSIHVKSCLGEGSTFQVNLPIYKPQPSQRK